MLLVPVKMEAPTGWNEVVHDSRGSVVPFNFCGTPAPVKI